MSKPSTPKINVRNLDPDIYGVLKKEAEKNCRSMEGEIRFALSLYVDCLRENRNQSTDIHQRIFDELMRLKEEVSRLSEKKEVL